MVETPATTFAAIAKMMTSPAENPKTDAASTPPNVNTPASPSRNTALASRNQTVSRCSRQSRAMSRPSRAYDAKKPTLPRSTAAGLRYSGTANSTGRANSAEPDGRDEHGHAHVEAALAGDAEQADLRAG